MADENQTNPDDATELASPEFTNTLAKWEAEDKEEEEVTPISQVGFRVASLRDRMASGLFDFLVLFYIYFGALLGYNYVIWREFLRPFPAQSNHVTIFHAIFVLFCFLYFFVSEGVFFTSLGKFFSRLSVTKKNGESPSLFAIILRNFFRPLDYLFLILPTWILLEKLKLRQRIGDIIAGTTVQKHRCAPSQHFTLFGNTASATVRLITGTIDLLFSMAWIGGICLLIDYQRPIFSFLVILLIPLFYLLWHVTWETLFNTTVGQWIFGCQLSQEEGSPVGFTEVMLRSFFKLFDTNPLGWAILYLSSHNQKPSDFVAGTFVVYAKRSWKVAIGVVLSIAVIAGVWAVGLTNPRNYLSPFFKIDFIPKIFTIRVGGRAGVAPSPGAAQNLFIRRFSYVMPDRTTLRPSAEYKPGETIYFSFDVTGFTVRNNEAWIQEDLTVQYPDNAVGFKQENIVNFHQMLKNPEIPLEIVNTLALPPNAQPGHYTLVLILHDRFSDHHLTEQRTFLVAP
ncbi:MAG: hypothetical protein A3H42_05135 [Deltaproteobacteria bacterium RIFCSPLOWO2_02_FULL_46_8]|nr:MAG: hypothetical protein A3H42_05135 [Deltaproteobacteria bacterium RIFCSPLOWO2_02_FULL_46_8]